MGMGEVRGALSLPEEGVEEQTLLAMSLLADRLNLGRHHSSSMATERQGARFKAQLWAEDSIFMVLTPKSYMPCSSA